jgi:putative ABC transport system permease protein
VSAWLVRWGLALRIARRDARRHRGRTLLVVAMVGLPVLAIVGADTLYRSNDVTPVEALPTTLGAADAQLVGDSRERIWADPATGEVWQQTSDEGNSPWTRAEVERALPHGSEVVEELAGQTSFRTELGYAQVAALAADLDDPLRDGVAELLEGRLPEDDGEVAISARIAHRGIAVGDQLALTRDDVPAEVVGIVRTPEESGGAVVLPPDAADLLTGKRSFFYADVPGGLDWPAVQKLNRLGLGVLSRDVVENPPPAAAWLPPGTSPDVTTVSAAEVAVAALIVAALVIEVVLLAGPAFAVGVRRQRRDLALVAATGGAPRDLRRAVLASGLLLGGGAAVIGAAIGVGLATAAIPVMEDHSDVLFGPLDVPWRDALLTVGVGVLAGLAAAYVPARQAARTDVVDALAGRRGQVRSSWKLPVVGLVVFAAGMVLVVMGAQGTELGVAGGAVLLLAGVVIAAPWLIGLLTPLGRVLPVPGRLAVRDATRNRTRTAPAVAAVMATVAGVTALAIGSTSDSAQGRRDYVPQAPMGAAVITADVDEAGWAGVEKMVREQAPGREVHRIEAMNYATPDGASLDLGVLEDGCSGALDDCRWYPVGGNVVTTHRDLVVADSATVRALDQGDLPEQVFHALDDGRVVVLGSGALHDDGTVTVQEVSFDGSGSTVLGSATLPAVEIPLTAGTPMSPALVPALTIVPPSLGDRLPPEVATSGIVAGGPDDPVTPDQEDQLSERLAGLTSYESVYVERGWTDDLAVARWLLVGVGGLLVLVATLTATGLALADARPDFATLAAIGAAPRTRRFMAMGTAAVIGGGGALVGVLVGLAPGIAVAYPLTSADYGSGAHPLVEVPWLLLGGVAVGVPLLAVAVTGLFVRSRLPMAARIG